MEKNQVISLAILFLLSLSLRAVVLFYLDEFFLDEPAYAQNIDEFLAKPTLVPHYLGEPVAWKPPLMFDLYAPFVKLFLSIGFPLEVSYRIPGFSVGIASIVVFYFLGKEFLGHEDALVASAIFSTFATNIFMGSLLMTDSLLVLFLLLGILCYVRGLKNDKLFLLAGACAFLGFLTKYYFAFMIPLLGAVYCLGRDRSVLRNRNFLASFLFVPLALLATYALFSLDNGLGALMLHVNFDFSSRNAPPSLLPVSFMLNLMVFLLLQIPWIGFSMMGIAKINRKDPAWLMILLWALLIAVPLAGTEAMFWYAMPCLPAFSLLAAKAIGGLKGNPLFTLLLVPLVSLIFFFTVAYSAPQMDQKEAGSYLANKGDTLFIVPTIKFISWPDYNSYYKDSPVPLALSSPAAVFYKSHDENPKSRISAAYLPYGKREVGELVSAYIAESDAQVIAVQTKYGCRGFESGEDACTYNFTIPDGFTETKTSQGGYSILEREIK